MATVRCSHTRSTQAISALHQPSGRHPLLSRQHSPLLLRHTPAASRHLRSTRRVQATQTTAVTAAAAAPPADTVKIQVAVPLQDAQQGLRLRVVPEGRGQAIEIASVQPGSVAEQMGVRVGQRVRSIMDPVRDGEMLALKDKPSLRFVSDVILMTRRAEVVMELDPSSVQQPAAGISLQPPLPTITAAELSAPRPTTTTTTTTTIAEQLASSYAALLADGSIPNQSVQSIPLTRQPQAPPATAQAPNNGNGTGAEYPATPSDGAQGGPEALTQMTDMQKRVQRRKDYMDVVAERDDTPFFAMVAAAFLLPAAIILGIAYSSGYLDQLYSQSLSNFS